MQRDMDLIREMLLNVEQNPEMDGRTEFIYQSPEEMGISGHSLEELAYHAKMLVEEDYLKGNARSGYTMPSIRCLTWKGHEFLDNIKDPGIWTKVKSRITGLQGIGLSIIAQIAEAEVKKHFGLT
jgi:hypothetical protein